MCCPGSAEAETEGVALSGWNGGLACGKDVVSWGGWATAGWAIEIGAPCGVGPGPGVVGAEGTGVDEAVGVSTTHILGVYQPIIIP